MKTEKRMLAFIEEEGKSYEAEITNIILCGIKITKTESVGPAGNNTHFPAVIFSVTKDASSTIHPKANMKLTHVAELLIQV